MLRANSRLRRTLGDGGVRFLEYACGAIQRILPHVEVTDWVEDSWSEASSVWASPRRTAIRMTLAIGQEDDSWSRSLRALVRRKLLLEIGGAAGRTLDKREFDICKGIALRISRILQRGLSDEIGASIEAIRDAFDEYIVAQHVEQFHGLVQMPLSSILDALHTLSEQSYENKALTFGCILESHGRAAGTGAYFPGHFLISKKYKALSDGFRTAYHISADGRILDFVDLDRFDKKPLTETHH